MPEQSALGDGEVLSDVSLRVVTGGLCFSPSSYKSVLSRGGSLCGLAYLGTPHPSWHLGHLQIQDRMRS